MRVLKTSVFGIFRAVALAVLLGYAVICIWLFLAQESMLFHPRKIAVNATLPFTHEHDEIYLDAPDGARLHGVRGVVVACSACEVDFWFDQADFRGSAGRSAGRTP